MPYLILYYTEALKLDNYVLIMAPAVILAAVATVFYGKLYDRFGFSNETCEILGIELPSLTIPVTPGRNMAIIIEIAAMNHRQKKMGYNTAEEFNKRLMAQLENSGENR